MNGQTKRRNLGVVTVPAGRRIFSLLAVFALASIAFVESPATASAQAPATFSMSSTSGPKGTVVHLQSVTPCPAPSGTTGWEVSAAVGYPGIVTLLPGAPVAADGSWSVTLTIGGTATNDVPYGPGPDSVQVVCQGSGSPAFQYASQVFDMTTSGQGYWLASNDVAGHPCGPCNNSGPGQTVNVMPSGDAGFYGPDAPPGWAAPLVGMAPDPTTGTGYWLVGSDGGVFAYGDTLFFGSLPGLGLKVQNIVGIAATPDGKGYWLVGSDGGVFSFGDARFYGSLPGDQIAPARPVVGIAATADGKGYWLVGADGGVFSFGDAQFYGSLPAEHTTPAKPIVGVATTPGANGYWLVGADGGVFSFGAAGFRGSIPGQGSNLSDNVVGIAATSDGNGYWLASADGVIFDFGDAPFQDTCAGGCTTDTGAPATFLGISTTPVTSSS
jgi:hypothetical protein